MAYVVIYDRAARYSTEHVDKPGDELELHEEYYGYFADEAEARRMFGTLADTDTDIIRAQLCKVEKDIDIDALRAERALRRANGEQL